MKPITNYSFISSLLNKQIQNFVSVKLLLAFLFVFMQTFAFGHSWTPNDLSLEYDECAGVLNVRVLIVNDDGDNDYLRYGELQYKDPSLGSWVGLLAVGQALLDNRHDVDGEDIGYFTPLYSGFTFQGRVGSGDNHYYRFSIVLPQNLLNYASLQFRFTSDADKMTLLTNPISDGGWYDVGFWSTSRMPVSFNGTILLGSIASPESVISELKNGKDLTLTWSNPTTWCGWKDASNWQVEYSKDNGQNFNTIGQRTTLTETLEFGKTYKYILRIKGTDKQNRTRYSQKSAPAVVVTEPLLAAPTDVTVKQKRCGEVSVSWRPSTMARKYTVQRSTDANFSTNKTDNVGGVAGLTIFTDDGVDEGNTYYYRVIAENDFQTATSARSNGITTFDRSGLPTSLNASFDVAKHKVVLTWQYDNASHKGPKDAFGNPTDLTFTIKRDRTVLKSGIKSDVRTFDDIEVTRCSRYVYTIIAKTSCDESEEVSTPYTIPSSGLSQIKMHASDGEYPNFVRLEWNKVHNAGTYRVYRDSILLSSIQDSTVTSYLDMDAVPGDEYTYEIKAESSCPRSIDTTIKPVSAFDIGYILPNGKITGHVKTLSGTFVEDVTIEATPNDGATLGHSLYLNESDAKTKDVVDFSVTDGFAIESWFKRDSLPQRYLDFDGVDDYLTIPSFTIGGDITIETWVNIERYETYPRLFEFGNPNGSNLSNSIAMTVQQNGVGVSISEQAWNWYDIPATTRAGWIHIAMTVDNNKKLKVYINGQQSGTDIQLTASAGNIQRNQNYIARSYFTSANEAKKLNCQMRDFRIWNVARTQNEIRSNMNKHLIGNEQELMVYYDFQTNTGTTLPDLAGGDQNATMNNFSSTSWKNEPAKLSEGLLMQTKSQNLALGITNERLQLYVNNWLSADMPDLYNDNKWHFYRLAYNDKNEMSLIVDKKTVWTRNIPDFKLTDTICFGGKTKLIAPSESGSVKQISAYDTRYDFTKQPFTLQTAVLPNTANGIIGTIGGNNIRIENNQYKLDMPINVLFDSTVNNNHIAFNTTTIQNQSETNNASRRDGLYFENGTKVDFGNSNELLFENKKEYTLEALVYIYNRTYDYDILSEDAGGTSLIFRIAQNNARLGRGNGFFDIGNIQDIPNADLIQISVTVEKKNNTAILTGYINGEYKNRQEVSLSDNNYAWLTNPSKSYSIGGSYGTLKQLRVWNKALLGTQISSYYGKTLTGKEADLGSYFDFSQQPVNNNSITSKPYVATSNGTLNNISSPWHVKEGMPFDGINDRIDAPFNSSLQIQNGQTFTFETMVYLKNTLVVSNSDGGGNGFRIRIREGNVQLSLRFYYVEFDVDSKLLPLNQWVHVAVTYNNKSVSLYINGTLINTRYNAEFYNMASQSNIQIGYYDYINSYFNGYMKHLRLWNVCRTASEIASNYNNQLTGTESGLVLYYDFEKQQSGSTITDYSPTQANGTKSGNMPTAWRTGVNFDGTTGYIDCGNDNELQIQTLDQFTIETSFVMDASVSDWKALVANISNNTKGFQLFVKPGVVYFSFNGIQQDFQASISDVVVGKQINLAVVYQNGTIYMYIDGVLKDSKVMSNAKETSDKNLLIGKAPEDTRLFNGSMQQIRIWNKARAQSEIAGDYQQSLTGKEDGLVLYYDFMRQTSGTVIKDLAAKGAKGTIQNTSDFAWNWHTKNNFNYFVMPAKTQAYLSYPNGFVQSNSDFRAIDFWFSVADASVQTQLLKYTNPDVTLYVNNGHLVTRDATGVMKDWNCEIQNNQYYHIQINWRQDNFNGFDYRGFVSEFYFENILFYSTRDNNHNPKAINDFLFGSNNNTQAIKWNKINGWSGNLEYPSDILKGIYPSSGYPSPLFSYRRSATYTNTITSTISTTPNQWQWLNIGIDKVNNTISFGGNTVKTPLINFQNSTLALGNADPNRFDELRLWKTYTTTAPTDFTRLQGNENNLIAYYTFTKNNQAYSHATADAPVLSVAGFNAAQEASSNSNNTNTTINSFRGWIANTRIWNTGAPFANESYVKAEYDYEPQKIVKDKETKDVVISSTPGGTNLLLSPGWKKSSESPGYSIAVLTDEHGNYMLDQVNYGGIKGRSFIITPSKAGHKFDPDNLLVTLDPSQTIVDQVNFTDLSSMPISGQIMYSNTLCYEQGKEIWLDGKSVSPAAETNEHGQWNTSVDMNNHTITVKLDTLVEGYNSSALRLNSSNHYDMGYINLNNKDFTIEFWYKRNIKDNTRQVLLAGGSMSKGVVVYLESGNINVVWQGEVFSKPLYFDNTEWHHFAITYEHISNNLLVFVDAGLIKSAFPSNTLSLSEHVVLGSLGTQYPFNGLIDEYRVWSKIITQDNISKNSQHLLKGNENSLLVYYNFDNISNGKAYNLRDSSIYINVTAATNIDPNGILSQAPVMYKYNPINTVYNPQNGIYKLFVDNPKNNLNFENTSVYTLDLGIRGNCEYSIGLSNVRITSTPECFDTLVTNVEKLLQISLPPLVYNVQVLPHDSRKHIAPKTISMKHGDTTVVFEYRTPLQVEITPSEASQKICSDKVVLKQFDYDEIEIETFEDYDGEKCPVEVTDVLLYNDISGRKNTADTLHLAEHSEGKGSYRYRVIYPNLADGGEHPFQRKIDIVATDTLGRRVTAQHWAYIKGVVTRPSTFTSRTPVLLMILRDPPGDMSYSYVEKGTSSSFTMGNSSVKDVTTGFNTTLTMAPTIETSIGPPGAEIKNEHQPIASLNTGLNITTSFGKNNEVTFNMTTTERFQTDGGGEIIGEDADLFIGGALNMIFAPADELYFDNCDAKVRTALAASPDTITTFFQYTRWHIKNNVIPYLDFLKQDTLNKMTAANKTQQQKNAVALRFRQDSLAWINMLNKNDQLKDNATFSRNISFTSGSSYETSVTIDTTATSTIETVTTTETALLTSAGYYFNGMGGQVDMGLTTTTTIGESQTNENSKSLTTGYFLADDDAGDFFSVSVYQDPVYKTPVFRTLAGQSMCPWEKKTQSREGFDFTTASNNTQNDVNPNEQAIFRINLNNTSHTQEAEFGYLSVLNASNSNGAIVSVNGVVLGASQVPVELQPRQNTTLLVSIKRGPLDYDYEGIKLMVKGCDGEVTPYEGFSTDDHKLSDTITLNVHFKRPCMQNLQITNPNNNWVYNMFSQQQNNNQLNIEFSSPDLATIKTDNKVKELKVEYMMQSGNTPYPLLNAKLNGQNMSDGNTYATMTGDVSTLDDNKYQLRVVAECFDKTTSKSEWVSGSLFRKPPQLFGVPEPADGLLDGEDKISISFDKEIVGSALRPYNVKLLGILANAENKNVSMKLDGLDDRAVLYQDSATASKFRNDNFTLEFWMKGAWNDEPTIISNRLGESQNTQGFSISGSKTGSLKISFTNGSNGAPVVFNTNTYIADNKWHHIALACSLQNQNNVSVTMFVDLTEQTTNTLPFRDFYTYKPFWAGAAAETPHTSFRGNIDEVRYWNKALTKNELLKTWRKTLVGNESGLVANWRLDKKGTAEGTFKEITGNCPDGTMLKGVVWDESDAAPIDYKAIVEEIPVTFSSFANQIQMVPNIEKRFIEDVQLTARVNRVKDIYGNQSAQTEWSFYVNQNNVGWEKPSVDVVKLADSVHTFTVNLVNNGNAITAFELKSLPSWLTADVEKGTLADFAEQPILFTVDKHIPNGVYHDTLFAETINGWEPLRIALHVTCPPPTEQVNPAKFEYSMAVSALLNIGGVNSTDRLDMVRAYVGNELRGVGHVQHLNNDKYLALMNIYSNVTADEVFNFRIWDASTCSDYVADSKTINFGLDNILGTIDNPITLTTTGEIEKTYRLQKGWNWVSFNTNPTKNSVLPYNISNFINTPASGDVIKSQTQVANYNNAAWVGSLSQLDNKNGYMYQSVGDNIIKTKGFLVSAQTPIELVKGWNWIGFVGDNYVRTQDALSGINKQAQSGDVILSQDEFAVFSTGNGWVGTLSYMGPQHAYKIKMSNSATLTLPTQKSNTLPETEIQQYQWQQKQLLSNVKTLTGWQVVPQAYSQSMAVVASVSLNNSTFDAKNCIVGAFVNGECRGVAIPVEYEGKTLLFARIYSNTDNEALYFKLYMSATGETIIADNVCNFGNDGMWGNLDKPYDIHLTTESETTDVPLPVLPKQYTLEQNQPNPFASQTVIGFSLPEETFVSITVYNVLGAKVRILASGQHKAGHYNVVWDGKDFNGLKQPSGLYYYRLETPQVTLTRSLIIGQ